MRHDLWPQVKATPMASGRIAEILTTPVCLDLCPQVHCLFATAPIPSGPVAARTQPMKACCRYVGGPLAIREMAAPEHFGGWGMIRKLLLGSVAAGGLLTTALCARAAASPSTACWSMRPGAGP